MSHVVLLGDSIFDNAAYVRGGLDVHAHLRAMLAPRWRVTLAAVDGAVIADVPRQIARVPSDATHLVVSAGGNDALGHADLLDRRASSSGEVLGWLADAAAAFTDGYEQMLVALAARALPTTVCTIYNGNLGPPHAHRATAALGVFNDVIARRARRRGLHLIELRDVCTDAADYANPIEPSVEGGAKIAYAIAEALDALAPGVLGTAPSGAG